MMSQHYTLVRLERELKIQAARARPSVPRRTRRGLRGALWARIPRRRPQPLLAPHQYLELEFIVEDRR